MRIISNSYPRAALIGNPSDGYFGKTIAFTFSNFSAEVKLEEASKLSFRASDSDALSFENLHSFTTKIRKYGYYGGIRLLMASLKKHAEFCESINIPVNKPNFELSYQSTIPQQLGFAGSSAIITACLKCLNTWFEIEMKPRILANLALSVETQELGIAAGLQDRVAQAFEQPVYMDFDKAHMDEAGYGKYQTFHPDLLPDLYIAYSEKLNESSEIVHNDLKKRFDQSDHEVLNAMKVFSKITDEFFQSLINKNTSRLISLMDENFDLRCSIMPVSEGNKLLVKTARKTGASAKLTGSGGAIIGIYKDKEMLDQLVQRFSRIGASIIIPRILNKTSG